MALKLKARMNMKGFIAEQKRLFAAVERGKRRGLMRGGGLVRQIARRSIRSGGKKNRASEPGEPVRWHTKPGIRDQIYFAYDDRGGTVPVGPLHFAGSDVPEKLEHGGTIEIRRVRYRNGQRVIEVRKVKVEPRPTMGLALETAAPKLAEQFKDQIR
jgi:hypothetical protein